jgi:hypothetical protein
MILICYGSEDAKAAIQQAGDSVVAVPARNHKADA